MNITCTYSIGFPIKETRALPPGDPLVRRERAGPLRLEVEDALLQCHAVIMARSQLHHWCKCQETKDCSNDMSTTIPGHGSAPKKYSVKVKQSERAEDLVGWFWRELGKFNRVPLILEGKGGGTRDSKEA
jgi:hypothetical protein